MKQIKKFADLARALNRGNSVVVDQTGVELNLFQGGLADEMPLPVKAAAYLGKNGDSKSYQRRITAPFLETNLLLKAGDFRMILSLCDDSAKVSEPSLKCVLIPAGGDCAFDEKIGYYSLAVDGLNGGKLTSDPKEGFKIIGMAVFEALTDKRLGSEIMAKGIKTSLTGRAADRVMAL
jgi:hypothetical protein